MRNRLVGEIWSLKATISFVLTIATGIGAVVFYVTESSLNALAPAILAAGILFVVTGKVTS